MPDALLPIRPFLYSVDQIATLLDLNVSTVKRVYLYYEGRSPGVRPRDKLLCHNIAPDGKHPEWRVAERELKRWLKSKGFTIYDTSWVRS